MSQLQEAVIVAYGRSAVARSGKKGMLRNTHSIEYGAEVLKGVLKNIPQLALEDIEDLILGCAKPELQQRQNIAKLIGLRAELPYSVAGQTVNRFCASSLETLAIAAQRIMTGQADVLVAGGVESMTCIPYMGIGDAAFKDEWLDKNQPGAYVGMGITAENVAKKYNLTRLQCDEFALASQEKAAKADASGFFASDIVLVNALQEDGSNCVFAKDECIRANSTIEGLSSLKPSFQEDGIVTAGSSSPTSDGASMLVVMSSSKAQQLALQPKAKFIAYAVAGVDPCYMGLGPISAVPKVLKMAGLTLNDMDVIELNEAFAAQSIPCIAELGLPPEKVNINGGAIALGHPLGATGGILVAKAIRQLEKSGGRYALVTMCIGGGMGAAGIIKHVDQ